MFKQEDSIASSLWRHRLNHYYAKQLLDKYKNCAYCGINFKKHNEKPTVEMIKEPKNPKNKNQLAELAEIENFALCCKACNSSKNALSVEIWLNGVKNKKYLDYQKCIEIENWTISAKHPDDKIKEIAQEIFSK